MYWTRNRLDASFVKNDHYVQCVACGDKGSDEDPTYMIMGVAHHVACYQTRLKPALDGIYAYNVFAEGAPRKRRKRQESD